MGLPTGSYRMKWRCNYCGFEGDASRTYYWRCPRCGSPLSLDYPVECEFSNSNVVWERYSGFTPFKPSKWRGEGLTPLVSEKNSGHTLLFKLDYLNPGGSFKDRGTALSIAYAYMLGYKKTLVDTSGNTGISVALYSKLYGLEPTIVMPKTAPVGKKKAVLKLGGRLVEAESRTAATQLVEEYTREPGVYYVGHLWSPLYIIGHATIAYEVYEDYGVPDYVILPIGSGGLLLGVVYGFEKLRECGFIEKTPRIIGVQGYSCQPVYRALYGVEEKGEDSTLADGVMVYNPPRAGEVAGKIREHGGDVVLVGNTEISRAHSELWQMGFLVEPTSAIVYAAYWRIREKIPSNSSILMVLTGSGLKTLL